MSALDVLTVENIETGLRDAAGNELEMETSIAFLFPWVLVLIELESSSS